MSDHKRSYPLDKRDRIEPPPRPRIPLIIWIVLAFILGAVLMYARLNSLYMEAESLSASRVTIAVQARADPKAAQFGYVGDAVIVASPANPTKPAATDALVSSTSSGKENDPQLTKLIGKKIELRYGNDLRPLEIGQSALVTGTIAGLSLAPKNQNRFNKGIASSMKVTSVESVHYKEGPSAQLWKFRFHLQQVARQQSEIFQFRSSADSNKTDYTDGNSAFGLIAGITYGDRRELSDTPLESALQNTGLAHYMAVSGTHMAMLAALVFFLLSACKLKRIWISILTFFICFTFTIFTGFASGSIRSLIMLAIALLAYSLWRRVDVLFSLGLAAIFMLIADPIMAVSLGFQLSFGTVMGIIIFGRYSQLWLSTLIPTALRHLSSTITNGLAVAIVATFITLPLTVNAFGIVPLIGPVSNLIIAPLLSLLLFFSFISHAFMIAIPVLGNFLFQMSLYLSDFIAIIILRLAQIPWASISLSSFSPFTVILFLIAIAGLWWFWPRPNKRDMKRFLALLSIVFIICSGYASVSDFKHYQSSGNTSKTITFLDVGQGDAMLLRDGTTTVLIDSGPSPARLQELLTEHKVKRIDYLIFTHDHEDHARGAQALSSRHKIKEIIIAEGAQISKVFQSISQRTNAPLVGALAGDILPLENLEIRFIWPLARVKDASANETNLVKLIVDTTPEELDESPINVVLNSGDAESPEVKRALNHDTNSQSLVVHDEIAAIDVLKVPHHGSKNSLDNALAQMITEPDNSLMNKISNTSGQIFRQLETDHAKKSMSSKKGAGIAVISSGKGNSYGHPRSEPLEVIDRYFQKLYRTDTHGSVTIDL